MEYIYSFIEYILTYRVYIYPFIEYIYSYMRYTYLLIRYIYSLMRYCRIQPTGWHRTAESAVWRGRK